MSFKVFRMHLLIASRAFSKMTHVQHYAVFCSIALDLVLALLSLDQPLVVRAPETHYNKAVVLDFVLSLGEKRNRGPPLKTSQKGSCRYFMLGAYIAPETEISFEKYVDPSGTLSHHLGNKVAHCINNDIAYLCVKNNQEAHILVFYMSKKDPAGFRVGDIIKMGFTIVAFHQASRNKDDKQICKLLLRTWTLLDDLFAKAVFKAHSTSEAKGPSVGSRLTQVVQSLVKKCFDFTNLAATTKIIPR
ncbi:hypothetical protein B0H17DRAFT_1129293 [Mycena rosella]|uniref:Uncharacterized protein n=1 Tax=Mycena rosella TaxID=1033263 RepID=A0AAD7GQ48_MYCRO|nr:hypothetical protein B0H17DRAFT_1129293 [Mycena rosella]